MTVGRIAATPDEALGDVADGATVLIGGFGGGGTPNNLVAALIAQGARDLTLVSSSYTQMWPLIEAGRARKLVTSFPAPWDPPKRALVLERYRRGELEIELVPQGTLAERLRAGGAGIPAFYLRPGAGTELAAGKEARSFDGVEFVLETALTGDLALIKAHRADPYGNLAYRLATRNFNVAAATAARRTVAEVDEVVPLGAIEPSAVVTPGIYVDRIVAIAKREFWSDISARIAAHVERGAAHRTIAKPRLTRELIGLRLRRELRPGMVVNLGVGLPAAVSNFVEADSGILLHAENGLLGFGPNAAPEAYDIELVNANGQPVVLHPGASLFSSDQAFGMLRGGHVDLSVLGAYEVDRHGNLANWKSAVQPLGALGGAMEAALARRVIVAMEHTTVSGAPKLVERCALPITARGVVASVVTDLAWIDITPVGFVLRELAPGWTAAEVQSLTGAPLRPDPALREMEL